jgi:hypothetical protein
MINDKILEELLYCIFPGGNTTLHLLVRNPSALEDLLAKAHQGGEIKWFTPFLPNFKGLTPLHLC